MDIEQINSIAINAGQKIMEVYNDPECFKDVDYKKDNSPLTLADKESNEIIVTNLNLYFPNIPIISEEGRDVPFTTRKNYEEFWLVDPLDGTKEFLKRNGEFTVNIALIRKGYPVIGVIYVPVSGKLYFMDGSNSYVVLNGEKKRLQVRNAEKKRIAVRSRSHASEEEDKLYQAFLVSEYTSKGSSLKFCEIAEGNADLYYRHGPTMEWDTAAGQAIVEGAGGNVYIGNYTTNRFLYNKENLLNPSFLCLGFSV